MARKETTTSARLRSEEIIEELEGRRAERDQATRHVDILIGQRAEMLLTVDDAQLRAHEEALAEAKRKLDRAEAWIAKLAADLQAVRDEEADAPKRQAYEEAVKAAESIRSRLANEYPRLAGE